MNEPEEELIVTGGVVAALYFLVAKPLLSLFGASPEEKAAILSVDTAQAADSPFSYQFQPFVDSFEQNNPAGTDLSTAVQTLKSSWDAQETHKPLTFTGDPFDIATAAEGIYSCFDFFKFAADYNKLFSIFSAFNTKVEVAAVDAYFTYNFGKPLWTFLKEGALLSFRGLKPDQLAAIVAMVNKLPNDN